MRGGVATATDPRVALKYEELWRQLAVDMVWRVKLPDEVWTELAKVPGCNADDLKTDCIASAHASFHFVWRRVLEPAGELPWSLTRGNLHENLAELQMGPQPDEQASRNLWGLCHLNYPRGQLVKGLRIFSQLSWTSLPCEQLHGSLAVFRRWHPEFGVAPLVCRALLLQVSRILVPSTSKAEKEMAATIESLRKLSRKRPTQGWDS